jgi:glycine/D-amino acid oxidase-like deaminating enzyme
VTGTQGVLAVNPWMKDFKSFERHQVPIYTYALMSDPLTDEQMATIGWTGREGVEDKRNYIHYFRLTKDNRILWAGSDAVYYYGSKIAGDVERSAAVHRFLEQTFAWYFPQLSSLRFPYRWGGPVAITADFLPYIGTVSGTNLHYGFGCNGHGVAPAHTWGQILRDLCLGKRTDITQLLFLDRKEIKWPREPLRYVGAELTRRAMLRQDAKMTKGKPVGDMDPFILRMMKKLGG